jgi:hypothetical protein
VLCRKTLPLPVFGGLTRPVLAAQWRLGSNWRQPPRLSVGLGVADEVAYSPLDDGATLSSSGTVAFRKKAFLTRRWGVEVRGGCVCVVLVLGGGAQTRSVWTILCWQHVLPGVALACS